jgi:hypothetical protein
MCVVYYTLFKEGVLGVPQTGRNRKALANFEADLQSNRQLAADESDETDFTLLEYDQIARSPNDAATIEFRVKTLRTYLVDA